MSRSAKEQQILRDEAQKLIAGNDNMQLAPDATTGEDDFKYEQAPTVCGVVVELHSGYGWVQISGGGKLEIVKTGRGETGFKIVEIKDGQSCMLYGRPTVLYIRPKP